MRTGGKFWSACLTFMIVLALGSGPLLVGATSSPYSWNPNVPCTPTIVKITDITNNSTGTTSYNTSPFSPGLTSPVGLAKRWLTQGATPPGWVFPGPPCTITDSQGNTVSIFVEVDHVRVTSAYVTETDCSSTFDSVNGGAKYSTGGTKCDVTANLYSNAVNSCTSTTDPGCWYKIHTEFDQDWQGAAYCGPGTVCDPAQAQAQIVGGSTYIDVQGFVYWDPSHVTEQWHSFSGWELHPLTALRLSNGVQGLASAFSFTPANPGLNQPVTFTATASGGSPPYSLRWSFGDGSVGTGSPISHPYSASGSYTVTLTVTDATGSSSITSKIVPVSGPPDYTISLSPTSLTVPVGGSGSSTVTLKSINGFTGTVSLAATISPSGPTASFSSTSLVLSSGGTSTSILTFQAPTTVAPGNYTVTVAATNGSRVHLATLLVNAKAVPDFTIVTNPSILTTVQGGSASSLITVTSLNGFSGSVSLKAQVSTGGVDVQVNPNNLNVRPGVNSSTTLSVSLHNDVIPITYTVTLQGQSGSITHLVTLPLIVTSFTLDVNPGSLSFRPGSSGTFNILLTSINGFAGNITLSDQANNQLATTLGSRLVYVPAGGTGATALTVGSSVQNNNNVVIIASVGRLSRSLQVQVFVNTQSDFFVSANPIFLAVPQGSSANSTITVTSVNGLSGNVNLQLGVNPGGPIVSISPLTLRLVSGGSASSILKVSVPSSVQAGIYSITVTGSDGPNHPVILTLYVTRPVPDFTLTSNPTSQTVLANNVATTTISLNNLDRFTGIVNLSSTISPTRGLSCTLTPAMISGSQTSNLSCNGSAGTYSVTVMGSSGGLTRSTVVTLAVQDFTISANPPTVSVTVGSSGNSTITITSLQGFSQTVILKSNSTACILTPSSATGSANSTMSCHFTSTGTFQVIVTGTSASLSHSATVTYSVGGVAGFTITANPSSLTVPANLAANSTITVSPTNEFTGTITLSSSVSPSSGLLCSLNPTTLTLGSTSTSALSCSGSAGLYSVTVSGTNGSVSHNTNVAYNVQDYNISANPSAVNVSGNNAGASNITLTPLSGFYAVVSLSTNSTSCTLIPTTLTGSGTATLSCTFSSIGTFNVGVTGTSGSLSHSITVPFIVNSAPSFTISASPNSATVPAGSNSTFTVTVSGQNGFSGTVALTSSVSPTTGLSCALSPTSLSLSNSTTSGTSTLACSGSAGSYTITVTGASGGFTSQTATVTVVVEDFTITGVPSSIGFNPGGNANSTISITGLQSFNGVVNLTASASSPSVTASLDSATVTGSGTATLTVSGSATGTYSVTVSGRSGSLFHNVTITVNVGAVDFQISASPASIILYPGGTNVSIVSVTGMNGFSGNVSLSATLPSGLSALFSSNPVAPGAMSTLTVSATNSIAAGTYTVTVAGTSGSLTHSVNVAVTVLTRPVIAFVAATPVAGSSSNSATTATMAFTKGNLIVVYITVGAGQTVSTITDSGSPSSTYTQRASAVNGNTILYLYTATAATSTNNTITVTMSASGYLQIGAAEYSGVIGFGASNTNTGLSTTPTVSLTTQNPNSWVIAAYGWTGTGTHSGDTGFTDRHAGSIGSQHLDYGDTNAAKPVGTYTYSATVSQSDPWAMIALELV